MNEIQCRALGTLVYNAQKNNDEAVIVAVSKAENDAYLASLTGKFDGRYLTMIYRIAADGDVTAT